METGEWCKAHMKQCVFVIDNFFSISIVDFFVFTCAVYLVTLGNFDKMPLKCSSCQW